MKLKALALLLLCNLGMQSMHANSWFDRQKPETRRNVYYGLSIASFLGAGYAWMKGVPFIASNPQPATTKTAFLMQKAPSVGLGGLGIYCLQQGRIASTFIPKSPDTNTAKPN